VEDLGFEDIFVHQREENVVQVDRNDLEHSFLGCRLERVGSVVVFRYIQVRLASTGDPRFKFSSESRSTYWQR